MRGATIRQIETAGWIDWLPIEINFAATELLTATLGVAQSEEFFRLLYRGLLDSPVLRPLLQGIRALGARSPLAYLKHTPRSYEAVFRGIGRLALIDESERHVELEFVDLPPPICFSPTMPWVPYTAAIYASTFDLTGCPGRYEVEEHAADGLARLRYDW